MVDQTNPNSQFHPYQPATDIPASEHSSSGLSGMLRKVGISGDMVDKVTGALSGMNVSGGVDKLKSSVSNINVDSVKEKWNNMDVKGSVNSARDYARRNPGKVLGGLALAVIGTGLLSQRSRSYSR